MSRQEEIRSIRIRRLFLPSPFVPLWGSKTESSVYRFSHVTRWIRFDTESIVIQLSPWGTDEMLPDFVCPILLAVLHIHYIHYYTIRLSRSC